jgi:hypothetical protein
MITLIPLAVFIYLYLKLQAVETNSIIQNPRYLLITQVVFFVIIFGTLTSVHLVVKKRMKLLSGKYGLGDKMDRYYTYALIRIAAGALASVIMGGGLFISGSEVFSVYFSLILLWMAYHWPIPKRMCTELRLKGDEREMILYKRESLN